jgi:uncharacterized protein with HEPN domain
MRPEDRDPGYVWDMFDAARTILNFTTGVTLEASQRNVLAHEYGEISQERIWLVATGRIPDLIGQLESLLPPAPPDKLP